LLESTELIVRGAFRARAQLASLRGVRADGGTLRFRAGDDEVALTLGPAASRWAAAIVKPPPSLAAKLGITKQKRIAGEGEIDDGALAEALAVGIAVGRDEPDIIVARVDDADALAHVAHRWSAQLERRVPLWVVYTKGKAAPLGEGVVRAMLRDRGLIDLKVAAVSPALTALQFVRRLPR
jgi:hypothetical protein